MKLVPIFASMILTLAAWGVQSSLLLLAQKHLGPWKTMFLYGAGVAMTSFISKR